MTKRIMVAIVAGTELTVKGKQYDGTVKTSYDQPEFYDLPDGTELDIYLVQGTQKMFNWLCRNPLVHFVEFR